MGETEKEALSSDVLDLLDIHLDDEELPDTASVSSSGASTSASSTIKPKTTNESELLILPVVGLYQRKALDLPKGVKELSISKMSRDQVMARKRVESGKGITFQPGYGHIESKYFNISSKELIKEGYEELLGERAVLMQSIDHYDTIRRHPDMAKYFANHDGDIETNHTSILDSPSFGEQIIIGTGTANDLCVGDILEIENGESSLKLEISSPRLCCMHVDKKNNSAYGLKGVRRHCNDTGLGGIFTRVLEQGELKEGMRFVRTANPHPKWTLANVCKSLYGEAPRDYSVKNWPYWSRSKEELEELNGLKQLGDYEWKYEVEYILEHWGWYQEHRMGGGGGGGGKAGGEKQEKSTNDSDDWGLSGIANIGFMKPLLSQAAPPIYRLLDFALSCNDGCCVPLDDDGHAWWG
jgi:MOSC domain-containing protein YiiM